MGELGLFELERNNVWPQKKRADPFEELPVLVQEIGILILLSLVADKLHRLKKQEVEGHQIPGAHYCERVP